MRQDLCSEFWLVAACCRWPPSERRIRAVQAEIDGIDWDRFIRVVRRHQVAGLVHDGLRKGAIALPDKVETELRGMARRIALDNLRSASEALRLQEMLANAGIAATVLKGVPFGLVAYGTIALRHSQDLDIIVPEADAVAEEIRIAAIRHPDHGGRAPIAWFCELLAEATEELRVGEISVGETS